MGTRLFVAGLPYSVTQQQLIDIFSKFGNVDSATIITDRFSGQSKGFGFVEMTTEEESKKAIEGLNDTEIEGRKIIVNEARPREERPNRDFGNRNNFNRNDKPRRFERGGYNRGGSKRW